MKTGVASSTKEEPGSRAGGAQAGDTTKITVRRKQMKTQTAGKQTSKFKESRNQITAVKTHRDLGQAEFQYGQAAACRRVRSGPRELPSAAVVFIWAINYVIIASAAWGLKNFEVSLFIGN